MRHKIAIVAVTTTLAACASDVTTIYSCSASPTIAATYTDGIAELRFGNGERFELPQIESETGERYSDGAVSWFTSGRDAILMRGGKTTRCDAL